jgi:predicted MPP superfamily phosphohydrolase
VAVPDDPGIANSIRRPPPVNNNERGSFFVPDRQVTSNAPSPLKATAMRLVWTTDLHLNHVGLAAWERWVQQVLEATPDRLLITGDLSEAEDVLFQLQRMAETFQRPIDFVLGNHDFYGSSIDSTRDRVRAFTKQSKYLNYLTGQSPIALGDETYLIGEDGWADATIGDYHRSPVRLNDFRWIEDFLNADPTRWPRLMTEQGAASAARLTKQLNLLGPNARHAWVATHIPPYREACWYQGHTADDNWAPFFVCGQIGEALSTFAKRRPEVDLRVLCGHTHHPGKTRILENLTVWTAGADYGQPGIARTIEV